MNHKIFLLTIYAFNAIFVCKAMENTSQFKELKVIKDPFFAQYITDDRAIIASEKECCIMNPITDEIVQKVTIKPLDSRHRIIHCTIHPNKKKFALTYKDIDKRAHTTAIYDTTSGKKEWFI